MKNINNSTNCYQILKDLYCKKDIYLQWKDNLIYNTLN